MGLAKALGETLAVMMLAGNAVAVPKSVLDRGQPLTSLIATELGEAGVGSPMYEALFSRRRDADGLSDINKFRVLEVEGPSVLQWLIKRGK